MDFERMGEAVGFRKTMDAMAADTDHAIAVANGRIAGLSAKVMDARKQTAEAQAALAVEQAHAAGLMAQIAALRAELAAARPDHALFKKTGRTLPDGQRQTALGVVYEAPFDAVLAKKGMDGKKYRKVAK